MTKYLKELNRAFGDFKFFPEDHHYEYKGKRIGMSVTRMIEQYTQEFDSDLIAERVALKQGKTKQEVLTEWKEKNEYACEKGSICHEFAQTLWKTDWHHDEPFLLFSFKMANKDLTNDKNIIKITDQALNFYLNYKNRLKHLADEFVIGSEEYDIASAIDHLFVNKMTGGLVLVDYKTNSDIHKNEKYAKKMQTPFGHLCDCTINHYFLQLSIYKYLVEKYTNLKIETMFIVYMSENIDNYEIIGVPYLEKEAGEMLEWNIWN